MTTTPSTQLSCGSTTYWAGGLDRIPDAEERIDAVGGSWERLRHVGEVIEQGIGDDGVGPRILFWQQGNWYDANGYELMHRVERLLAPYGRYRGYLTPSDWSVTHDVVFIREAVANEPHLWVRHHWAHPEPEIDGSVPRVGLIEAQVGDNGPTLLLRSMMLFPYSGTRRVEQIKGIVGAVGDHVKAAPGVVPLLAGSFNSVDSHPNNPVRDWNAFGATDPERALHKGKVDFENGQWSADTGVFDYLLGRWSPAANRRLGGAGWISLTQGDDNWQPTSDDKPEYGLLKINDFVSTRDICVPGTSRTHAALSAGRHRYITITVEV
jgi:hypothetical protein